MKSATKVYQSKISEIKKLAKAAQGSFQTEITVATNADNARNTKIIKTFADELIQAHHDFEDQIGGRVEGPGALGEVLVAQFVRRLSATQQSTRRNAINKFRSQSAKSLRDLVKGIEKL